MRYFQILTEAKLSFTAAQFAQAVADSEFGVVILTMTGDGGLHLGRLWHARGDSTDPEYHADVSHRRSLAMTLFVANKEVDIRLGSVGESLRPKVQQALRSLRDAGIIDATWTIKTAANAAYYQGSTFTRAPNPIDQQGLDRLADKAIRLSAVSHDLTFYHGTSGLDWLKIQKVGLVPLGTGSNATHGYESRAKHDGNTRVLYLAGTMDKAHGYAKLRVASLNKLRHGSEHIHSEGNDPVILAVRIPDPGRLVADDDVVNDMARGISRKLWKAKPDAEKQAICADLARERGFKVNTDIGEMLWRETDAGFAEIMARIPPAVFKVWKASLTRTNQVGYKGIIPPKFITRVL